jgi:hypothetical protein
MLASLSNISAYAGDYNPDANYWNFTTRNGKCPVTYGSWETPYDWDETSPTMPQRVTHDAQNDNIGAGL